MRKLILYPTLFLLPLAIAGCSEERFAGQEPEIDAGHPIRLQASIDQLNVSRADDSGFADGDRIGVYAVAFEADGNPGILGPNNNLVGNLAFTYQGDSNTWAGDRDIYFPDDRTPVDFYSYYPYTGEIDNPGAYPVTVARNQSEEAGGGRLSAYEQSDLLWGKVSGVTPSTPLVSIMMKHVLAGVMVTLIEGEGFDSGEWGGLEKSVLVNSTVTSGFADFSTGEITVADNIGSTSVTSVAHGDDYRAIVIPQTVSKDTELLTINLDSDSYIFTKDIPMTYVPGKLHKFTIKVNKQVPDGKYVFTILDEVITAWESDLQSHDGIAKEYVVVEVLKEGCLEQSIAATGLVASEIKNLKLKGRLDDRDFTFMREKMPYLEALNMKEIHLGKVSAVYDGEPEEYTLPAIACAGMKTLTYVVLPEKMKRIGEMAFLGTNISGSLILPEGLEYIGGEAFGSTTWGWDGIWSGGYGSSAFPEGHPLVYNSLTGRLILPSTLKYIGDKAFYNCKFTGELVLPEGLEYIGSAAFSNCDGFTGEIHLPNTLKEIGGGAFENMMGIKGVLQVPRSFTRIENYGFLPVESVYLPESLESIASDAFFRMPLKGDMIIPEGVTAIGSRAFAMTELRHIIFPENLEFLENEICWNMELLQDTIIIPPHIESIGERAFANCPKLEAVVIPARVERIKSGAFDNCFSLNYIRCDATTPPDIDESAFNGVPKDNFTVEVPEESVDKYRNAPGWSEFKRIAAYRNFVARPSKYNVLNKGGKKEIILNADGAWEITECPSWCHLDKTSGSKKTVITLTVDEMAHGQAPRSGIISFRLKDGEGYNTHINVGQYDYEHDEDSYVQLQKATKGAGINLFFVGDGYDAVDISNGLYMKDMRQEMEYFFAVEPYTTYRDYFNVYTSIAMSEDSGTEDVNHWRNTKFHGAIWNSDVRLKIDWESALDYCALTVPPIMNKPDPKVGVILVMNTEMYEGVTHLVGDSFCAVVTKSTSDYPNDARGIVQHEAGGHGIGWLADEYMYHAAFIQKCTCTCCGHINELLGLQSWGFGLNLSLSGKYHDVPWSHLIYNSSYSDIVDVYEGGYFHTRGVYRSERNSCMNNNVPYHSTWNRQLIVQRIMMLAGEKFSLENFYALDNRSIGKDFTSTTRGDVVSIDYALHGLPPVIVKDYKFGKKGGKK